MHGRMFPGFAILKTAISIGVREHWVRGCSPDALLILTEWEELCARPRPHFQTSECPTDVVDARGFT